MGGQCPRAPDLNGPRETEKEKEVYEEKKRKEKEKKRKTIFKYRDVTSIRYIPISLSSYRKIYPTEGQIPKSNLKLVISTKYLKYDMNNGELGPMYYFQAYMTP